MSDRSAVIQEIDERFLGGAKAAAAFLGVSEGFVYKYIHEIPHIKLGGSKSGKLIFKMAELLAYAESRRVVPLVKPSNIAEASA